MHTDSLVLTTMASKYRHRFDFDIGHLVKSPCRECRDNGLLPACMDACPMLDRIRTVLANSVSCTRSSVSVESHAIYLESKDQQ
jgi:hypothetical protein